MAVARTAEARERVVGEARALGFDVVGIARADLPLEEDHRRYLDFVERGWHGEMGYLADHREARRALDSASILPGAKSVICVGKRYKRAPEAERADDGISPRVARYARGRDYHTFLRRRLRRLAKFVRELFPGVEARPLCDVEPVLERAWAARAGLGFIGKNGLVITPGQGSYQLLGEVVTTLSLPADVPLAERCGACTRCLDACPTQAFAAPFVLEATKCLSYLTIERRAPLPEPLREALGERLFGCDACQEVCPFNATAPATPDRTRDFEPSVRWAARSRDPGGPDGPATLRDVVTWDEEGFERASRGSPLRRPGRAALAAHAVVAASNTLNALGAAADETTRDDQGRNDHARVGHARNEERSECREVVSLATAHDDPGVREVARWAAARLADGPPRR